MAASNRRDLFISVNGSVTGLAATMKAGKSLLHDFGTDSVNVLELVEQKLGEVGSGGLPGLKQAEQNFDATFKRIRDNARSVLNASSSQAAIQIVDVTATQEAARAAEQKAAAYRLVAEAATRADQAQNGQNAAVRAYAVAAAAAAVEAEQESRALREQAGLLAQVDGQLDKSAAAQRRQVVVNGQTRAGYQQLSFQLGDVATQYAAGTSASIIFAQQSGQVIQAIQLIAGEAKGIIGFLGGPWGVAFSAALVALTPFVGKLLEGGDALKKETDELKENAQKTAVADQAKQAFLRTEAGAIDDVRALTEELKKQNEALGTNAERLNVRAKLRLQTLQEARADVAGDLDAARRTRETASRSSSEAAPGIVAAQTTRINGLETRLKNIDRAIADANAARLQTQKDLAAEAATRANDPIAAINRRYDGSNGLIEQAKKRASAEDVVNGALTRQLATLKAQQKAEVEAEQKRERAANRTQNNNQVGRTVDVAEATRIAASIGGRVTSGLRSTERQAQLYADKLAGRHSGPVAKPGTSDHERGQAIDIAFAPGLTVSKIREAFAKEGVAIRQLLVERDQKVFHVAFGPKGKSQESIDRSAEAVRQKQIRDDEAYAALKLRAQQELLETTRGQVTSIEQSADLDAQRVTIEAQRLSEAADAGVLQKRWTQAEADQLKLVYGFTAGMKVRAIREREADELARRKLDIQRDDTDAAIGLLQQQGDLATTAAERRRIALEILALEERIARATLEAAIAAEKDPERKAGLQRRLGEVDQVFAGRREQLNRQTEGPFDAYRRQLRASIDDMDLALEEVQVNALRGVEDGLLGIISGTESAGDAFKRMAQSIIADLARIAIQKAIVAAIGTAAGGFFGIPLADGGPVLRRAGGGPVFGAGGPREDRIPAMLSNGEYVINAAAYARHPALVEAINSDRLPRFATGGPVSGLRLPSIPRLSALGSAGGREPIVLRVGLSDDLHATIESKARNVSVEVVRSAAPELVQASTNNTINELRKQTL